MLPTYAIVGLAIATPLLTLAPDWLASYVPERYQQSSISTRRDPRKHPPISTRSRYE
jgi:hypothetical protein